MRPSQMRRRLLGVVGLAGGIALVAPALTTGARAGTPTNGNLAPACANIDPNSGSVSLTTITIQHGKSKHVSTVGQVQATFASTSADCTESGTVVPVSYALHVASVNGRLATVGNGAAESATNEPVDSVGGTPLGWSGTTVQGATGDVAAGTTPTQDFSVSSNIDGTDVAATIPAQNSWQTYTVSGFTSSDYMAANSCVDLYLVVLVNGVPANQSSVRSACVSGAPSSGWF